MTTAPADRSSFRSVSAVAEHLDVSTKTVRRGIESGELHFHRFGRRLRIADDDLAAFVALRRR
jgi:excisionase family DNA binding protein